MVDCQVALLVDRGQLKLIGRHLVVTRLTGDGQLQRLDLQILHESLYAIRNRAEVMIIHLLVFRTLMTHQCASGHQQVRAR